MSNKWSLVLLFLIGGCSTNVTPTLNPTAVSTPPPTAAPTAPPTETRQAAPAEDALQVFPLKRGAQWVYREIAYDTIPNDVLPQVVNRQITATLLITDTVMDTQMQTGKYAAQVVRERTLISTTIALGDLGEYGDVVFANNNPPVKWYIFTENKIYSQFENLDWDAVETSTLELQLPLTEGSRWYPLAEQRAQFSVEEAIPGLRVVEPAPRLRLPAGDFAGCFVLHDFYNTGGVQTDFCPGAGIVGEGFDHAGTPFGSHSVLEKFRPGE